MPQKQQRNNKQAAVKAIAKRRQPNNRPAVVSYARPRATPAPAPNKITTQLAELVQGNSPSGQYSLHLSSLPWIKNIAPNYQKWALRNARIWFEPSVGTQVQGTLHMCRVTDHADKPYTTALHYMNTAGAVRASVGSRIMLRQFDTPTYLYSSLDDFNAMTTTDKNDRSPGLINVFVEGVPTTGDGSVANGALIGRIYMEFSPILTSPIDPELNG